eukprot:jgi/Mesen1/4602/ME000232S03854
MTHKLQVRLLSARGLAAKDSNGFSDPFVRLTLGKSKAKSTTIYKNLDPVWNQDFYFKVASPVHDTLQLTVWDEDYLTADFLGQVSLPLVNVHNAESKMLPASWYRLQKKNAKSRSKISGEICLALYLSGQEDSQPGSTHNSPEHVLASIPAARESDSDSPASSPLYSSTPGSGGFDSIPNSGSLQGGSLVSNGRRVISEPGAARPSLRHRLSSAFASTSHRDTLVTPPPAFKWASPDTVSSPKAAAARGEGATSPASSMLQPSESISSSVDDGEHEQIVPAAWFDEDLREVPSPGPMPPPYAGGVVLEQAYAVPVHQLNSIYFGPDSEFAQELATERKLTQLEVSSWTQAAGEPIKRTVTYMTAPSSIVKSVRATEYQQYTRADAGGYLVENSVATPDVPYGNHFRAEVQYCLTPVDEKTSHLRISWRATFLQSTMMKGMIENGMRSGIKENYTVCAQILAKYAPPAALPSGKLAEQQEEVKPQTQLEVAREYFLNASTVVSLLALLIVPIHISWARTFRQPKSGLQRWGIDLPDTYLELLLTAVIVLCFERFLWRIHAFVAARLLRRYVRAQVHRKTAEKNSHFQQLFGLPENEFLIDDFSCAVKKKIPFQGRLFLSPRLLAFNSNMFGARIKFTLLWEDILEIREASSHSSAAIQRILAPFITLYVKPGKGGDAQHGSYGMEPDGRMKFRFLSFVRPSTAFRTIQVLWKNRALPPEQQIRMVDEDKQQQEDSPGPAVGASGRQEQMDDDGSFVGEDAEMEQVACVDIPVSVEQFLALVDHQELMEKVAEVSGQLNWTASPWDAASQSDGRGGTTLWHREVTYTLTRQTSSFGTAVTATQQKSKSPSGDWARMEELITMHDVPFGDSFQVETRKELRMKSASPPVTELSAKVGISWQKEVAMKDKIAHNVKEYYKKHNKAVIEVLVREVIAATQGGGKAAGSTRWA